MEALSPCTSFDCRLPEGSPIFADSLKELRNLRSQLYSAAEYFEVYCKKNMQKPTVMTSLKHYTVEAFVNTIDHLSFVSYTVNDSVTEKADEVSEAELRLLSAEQRVRTCQEVLNFEGRSEQSLVIRVPKYHARYILNEGEKEIKSSNVSPFKEFPQRNSYSMLHRDTKDRRTSCVISSPPTSRQSTSRASRAPLPPQTCTPRSRSLSPSRRAEPIFPSPRANFPVRGNFAEERQGSPVPTAAAAASPLLHSRNYFQINSSKEADRSAKAAKISLKSLLSIRRTRKKGDDEYLYSYLDECY